MIQGVVRRRSSSAARNADSTAPLNLVNRIGASLRISARKRMKERRHPDSLASYPSVDEGCGEAQRNNQSDGVMPTELRRRRSSGSTVFYHRDGTALHNLSFADADEDGDEDDGVICGAGPLHPVITSPAVSRRSVSMVARPAASKSNVGGGLIEFIDASTDDDERESGAEVLGGNNADHDASLDELLNAALAPLARSAHPTYKSFSALSSPIVHSHRVRQKGGYAGQLATRGCRSGPPTPQPLRRLHLKEGSAKFTSLSTFSSHHRYLFLFDDLLLIAKEKGEHSYKLKERVRLERLWVASNNCTHSFVLGWPIRNYVVQFAFEAEKNQWYHRLLESVKRHHVDRSTTISVAIAIEGREQTIRKEVRNGLRASELIAELVEELDLPTLDPNLGLYELAFESSSPAAYATVADEIGGGRRRSVPHLSTKRHRLNGIENLYSILMDHAATSSAGAVLSESQLSHLDTCPSVNCGFVLKQANAEGSAHGMAVRVNSATNLMNQFKRVLSRTDVSGSTKHRIFGRQLKGTMPPQPILTLIDHLSMNGTEVEGIFRKSPKQATVRLLKGQLDSGTVPDFHESNVHVAASLLKEYLRSIPGHLLISANYHIWIECMRQQDEEKRLRACRHLLRLLPPAHVVLLRSVLRLLRGIAAAEASSKMGVESLAVCIAPSLLENQRAPNSAREVPELIAFLIENAPQLFDNFGAPSLNGPSRATSAPIAIIQSDASADGGANESRLLYRSTDSGLSGDDGSAASAIKTHSFPANVTAMASSMRRVGMSQSLLVSALHRVDSSDSALVDPANSEECGDCSASEEERVPSTRELQERKHSSATDVPTTEEMHAEEDKTPVLSRENSDVKYHYCAPAFDRHRGRGEPLSTDNERTMTRRGVTSEIYASVRKKPEREVPAGLVEWRLATNRGPSKKSPEENLSATSAAPAAHNALRKLPSTTRLLLQPPKLTDTMPTLQRGEPRSASLVNRQRTATAGGDVGRAARNGSERRAWRPAKKTAEEILLDRLEVNWSVSSLRSMFTSKDQKPARIDTVYGAVRKQN